MIGTAGLGQTSSPVEMSRLDGASGESLKDRDSIGFVYDLQTGERQPWFDWMRRLRVADRFAETDRYVFNQLYKAFWTVISHGFHFGTPRESAAWLSYIEALDGYHRPGLVIHTIEEHDDMSERLSGPLLQLAPGMPVGLWDVAAKLGALDQFFNNMRDIQEDAERGLCWLPQDFLGHYDLTRADVISGRAAHSQEWPALMRRWLQHGRLLYARAEPLFAAPLPTPIAAMLSWTLDRYDRIERTLVAVDYDYRRFPQVYWAEVRRRLAGKEDGSFAV